MIRGHCSDEKNTNYYNLAYLVLFIIICLLEDYDQNMQASRY
jgi:hypothetical protein